MRRTVTITIPSGDGNDKNRDKGKVFLLTEMPAEQAARWATRAIVAILKAGADIPDDVAQAGMAGIAALGLRAFAGVDFDTLEGLMMEMQQCIQVVPSPSMVRPLMTEDDIEEVSTLMKLRMEVFALHTGFSLAELKLKLTSALKTSPPTS